MNRLLLTATAGGALAVAAAGQPSQPATTQAEAWELPDPVRAALAQTQDSVFNFDQPGFYAVLDFVKRSPHSPGFAQTPIVVDDWRALLERPGDFRGRPVTIEGLVGRNKAPYTLLSHPELGLISQLELRRDDQPLQCTLILSSPASDIPLGASMTVTGYFVMIRKYYGPSNNVHQAALLVAPGPTSVGQHVPRAAQTNWTWATAALVVGLIMAWVLLRRSAGRRQPELHALRASRGAPLNLADDLAAWAGRERPPAGSGPPEDARADDGRNP